LPPLPQRNLTVRTVQRDPPRLGGERFWRAAPAIDWGPYKGILLASVGKLLACVNQGKAQRDPPRLGEERFWQAGDQAKGPSSPRRGKVLACGSHNGDPQRDPPRLGGERFWRGRPFDAGTLRCVAGPKRSPRQRVAAKRYRILVAPICPSAGQRPEEALVISVRCEGSCGRACSFQVSGTSYCSGEGSCVSLTSQGLPRPRARGSSRTVRPEAAYGLRHCRW